jgi:hypothetical protein
MAADPTYPNTGIQLRRGTTAAVPSGSTLDIESGGVLAIAGTDRTSALATSPAAVAAGYKIARGETALDGSNPTAVATGLTTVVAFVATLKGTAAPGVGTSILTADISGATANVYAWKVTGAGDTTLIASTGTESFYWVAVGT